MILLGDIGGTNARLALAEPGTTDPVSEWRVATADFSDFPSVLAAFVAETGATITAGCLAVAGPIDDTGRSANFTNLPWTIDADALERRFGIGRLTLANDFAAAAMGVTVAPAETLVPLQEGEPLADAPKLVIGAGTGLGMATLVADKGGWRVLPGEGGHAGFAPQDADQDRILHALRAEHGRVTAERVISGPGLTAIHRVLTGESLDSAEIAHRAMVDADQAALDTLDIFLSAYGAFAGDMAMAVLARGGVYLAGGIAAKLLPILPASPFLPAFGAKAEHAHLVRQIPILVVTDPSLGLRGAACLA
ncbi:MAG: glucokinase [Gammaproteobacteria bacterium]|nr:glucokinase [Gammaproteobacteria bacterium]MBU1416462.1 glucokinase [Gammaproteobacteria bacterium]